MFLKTVDILDKSGIMLGMDSQNQKKDTYDSASSNIRESGQQEK